MQRRTFLKTTLAAVTATDVFSKVTSLRGGPVLDTHLHLRRDPDSCYTHLEGCGVTNAVLLTRASDEDKAKAEMVKRPGVFARSVAMDPAQPGAEEVIRQAIRDGAVSVGELKYHLALDSPEMRRIYEVCAEMQIPVMMHIQSFPHFAGELPYNTGYPQFDKVLRAYPKTNFIGHGDLFWAHISADVPADRGYPSVLPVRSSSSIRASMLRPCRTSQARTAMPSISMARQGSAARSRCGEGWNKAAPHPARRSSLWCTEDHPTPKYTALWTSAQPAYPDIAALRLLDRNSSSPGQREN
jgi:hypothetical protein